MHIYRLCLLILTGVLSLSSVSQNYSLGIDEYFNGDLNKSIKYFSLAIELGERLPESYMMRGAAKGLVDDFYGACKDLEQAGRLDSANYMVYYYFGKYHLNYGFSSLAIEYLDKSVACLTEIDPKVYNMRAIAKIESRDFVGAIEDQTVAINSNPEEASYYTNRGFAFLMIEDLETAVLDLTKSLDLKVSHRAYANRGKAYMSLRRFDMAVEDFSSALEIIPEDFVVLYYRGLCYEALSETRQACYDFNKSAEYGSTEAVRKKKTYCAD